MSIAQTVTLTNTGDALFVPVVSAVSGPNASEFSVSNGCSSFLAAGSSCVISVTFDPTTAGGKSASIPVSATDSVTGLPVMLSLSGSAF
jgi:HYDIN/CFA65/VesB-like, Ig-like domain